MQHAFKFKEAPAEEKSGHLPKVEYDFPESPFNGIALVGEAPGAEEVRLGHPFVGRSGQLLNKTLASANIERAECFVGNVFRFQPPGNKVDHFFISKRAAARQDITIDEKWGKFGSAYCRAAFAGELDHLQAALEKMKKKHKKIVVVALGRTPLWALTGENELLKKIGKPLPCRMLPGIEVIPTFHPSFILRGNWARQDEWRGHFIEAKNFLMV